MIILIDMDEVIADFEGKLRELWAAKYPHTPLFTDGVRDSFYIGDSNNQGRWDLVQKIIQAKGFFKSLKPVPGAQTAIQEMRDLGHYVFILTSPGISYPEAASDKVKWVTEHFDKEMLEYLIITPAKPMIRGDILIDDRPDIPHSASATWEHVLFEKSYNIAVNDDRRHLTWETWKDVLPELLQRKGEER